MLKKQKNNWKNAVSWLVSFFHGSRIAGISGIHYSDALKEAYYQIKSGKKITNIGNPAGYENWMGFHSDKFDFYYPRDWQASAISNLLICINNRSNERRLVMKCNEIPNKPYDPDKEERAIFQLVLILMFALILAFVAGSIISDLGWQVIKLVNTSNQ